MSRAKNSTSPSVSQRGVPYSISRVPIQPVNQWLKWVRFMKRIFNNDKKSRDTATLSAHLWKPSSSGLKMKFCWGYRIKNLETSQEFFSLTAGSARASVSFSFTPCSNETVICSYLLRPFQIYTVQYIYSHFSLSLTLSYLSDIMRKYQYI